MVDFKLLSVLKKFMTEEEYSAFEEKAKEFESAINTDIQKYITANAPNEEELKAEAKKTAHSEVIKELAISGVDTVDQLKAHVATVNSSTTEKDETIKRLNKEIQEANTKYGELETNYNSVNTKVINSEVKSLLAKEGFNQTFHDDLLLVALSKKKDDNSYEDVIADMKNNTHKHYLASGDFGGHVEEGSKQKPAEVDEALVDKWKEEAGL